MLDQCQLSLVYLITDDDDEGGDLDATRHDAAMKRKMKENMKMVMLRMS